MSDNIDINNLFGDDDIPEETQKKTPSEAGGGIVELAYDISPERHNEIDAEIDALWGQADLVSDTLTRATKEIAKTDVEKQAVGYIIGRRVGMLSIHKALVENPGLVLKLMGM